MINDYEIVRNVFTNIYMFGTGSDAFFISLYSPVLTSTLGVNLDSNIFEHLNT